MKLFSWCNLSLYLTGLTLQATWVLFKSVIITDKLTTIVLVVMKINMCVYVLVRLDKYSDVIYILFLSVPWSLQFLYLSFSIKWLVRFTYLICLSKMFYPWGKLAKLECAKLMFLRHQPQEMGKHTQTIRRQQPTNCLSVFDHF